MLIYRPTPNVTRTTPQNFIYISVINNCIAD